MQLNQVHIIQFRHSYKLSNTPKIQYCPCFCSCARVHKGQFLKTVLLPDFYCKNQYYGFETYFLFDIAAITNYKNIKYYVFCFHETNHTCSYKFITQSCEHYTKMLLLLYLVTVLVSLLQCDDITQIIKIGEGHVRQVTNGARWSDQYEFCHVNQAQPKFFVQKLKFNYKLTFKRQILTSKESIIILSWLSWFEFSYFWDESLLAFLAHKAKNYIIPFF
eukprot:TRINITY_DN3628_c0_g1_i1.p3 TRINITY_DN3628_c0_g1~~TRINITY_DN3628_c0_g1_i1.p3  ORF type:complete len:219 (-),score=-15.14 TRINITY_DN3628_c0_g1_i1:430-1086(-)